MLHIKKMEDFIKENSNLSFSYKGDTLPTQDMIDWFSYETNQMSSDMNYLEQDEFLSNQENNFFEEFRDELMDLSYFEMLDVFKKAKEESIYY